MAAREPASETAAASRQGWTAVDGAAAIRGNASLSCLRNKVGRVIKFRVPGNVNMYAFDTRAQRKCKGKQVFAS